MSQQTQVCSNCRAQIADSVFALHEIYCLRNNVECKRCGQFYDKNEPEAHEEEFHKGVTCEHCKQVFQDITKHTNCSKKQVSCLHCGLDFNKDAIFQHENMCGSRTEKCDICKQYIMIRDLPKHTGNCVPPKPKELVQEKSQPIQKTAEPRQQYQPIPNYKPTEQRPYEQKPNDYRLQEQRPNDYRLQEQKPIEQRMYEQKPQEYKQRQEYEYQKQPPQMHAKHEIFGYEKPQTPIEQQKNQRQYQAEKPLESRKDTSSNRRQQQQPVQQQVVMDYKYKPKDVPLQPTNAIKRQQQGQFEQRNQYMNQEKIVDKYSQPQQKQLDRKQHDQRSYDPNTYVNKYPENKYQEPKQHFEQKFSDQNLHRQLNQPSQKISQPKPQDHELDYLALGLTKEEIEQQKAYLESIQQQKKHQEPQQRVQEYKPRSDYQVARAYK